jgi:hypothetical protein
LSLDDIREAIYGDKKKPNESNAFIKFLKKNKKKEALDYLNMAYRCNAFSGGGDSWSFKGASFDKEHQRLIDLTFALANTSKDKELQKRYAFLSIRLAHYAGKAEKVRQTYEQFFSKQKERNIIDYWAMYFYALSLKESAERNFFAAQVFVNAPDKRWSIHRFYKASIELKSVLALAGNKEEEAAVYVMQALRSPGKNLALLKKIYELAPKSDGVDFILYREINKLEDWIFTSVYVNANTYLHSRILPKNDEKQARIASDRAYAGEILAFLNGLSAQQVKNPIALQTAKAYLSFMSGDAKKALAEIELSLKLADKDAAALKEQLSSLQLLFKTSATAITNDQLPDELKMSLLTVNKENLRLFFALAKELEFKGNKNLTALLMSKLGGYKLAWYSEKKQKLYPWMDYADGMFSYIESYSVEEVQALVDALKKADKNGKFESWAFAELQQGEIRLLELLGTKYLGKNDLNKALAVFEQIPAAHWKGSPYKEMLAANPFYTDFHSEHTKTAADTIVYTKVSLLRTLIDYLKKAEDPSRTDRDYYYFLVANCYFNMTHHGNSWLMRRQFWSVNIFHHNMEDDAEYHQCLSAIKYYEKAGEVSKSNKFKELCLAMAGRCENYRLAYTGLDLAQYNWWESPSINSEDLRSKNAYYKKLESSNPNAYEDLVSNCYGFDAYFSDRK